MRFEGTVKSWNDDRAFGFIEPCQGGQEIFLHITALPARATRPALNQSVTFELEVNRDGKKRAKNVQFARAARPIRSPRRPSTAQWGGATLFAIPAFLLVYMASALFWHVPLAVGVAYVTMSVICFITYAIDKSAAQSGAWRTPESILHLLGLLCGWPGALLAQQLLRHKSTKAPFRAAFWGTVALNVGAFLILSYLTVHAWRG
ncbi:DUF1294 domain-containing protein [Rhodoferax sp. PAMC 29310]|uniref:DUF1294 domain-containing protein n=1 Tax=Rhodoferax sp. PAMC 29310 TaxID=2822760 RepID=UPI001B326991|nr:DUF1294 domain-containing protein [Rhodoferax sp. PAMC 29310]